MAKPTDEELTKLSRTLADQGRLVEAGWISLLSLTVKPDTPQTQIAGLRNAFFSGASHLLASIMTILDPDAEPNEADLSRITSIAEELDEFDEQWKKERERHD